VPLALLPSQRTGLVPWLLVELQVLVIAHALQLALSVERSSVGSWFIRGLG
jgi:hypothetical protein